MNSEHEAEKIKNKIFKFWEEYESNTTLLSTVCRQLAFAEGGVCWFFKDLHVKFPHEITLVLTFLVGYFLLDTLQYLASTLLYWGFAKYYENKINKKLLKKAREIKRPGWINLPAKIFFISKIIVLGIASYFLMEFFISL